MKKTDIAAVVAIAIIGTLIAFFTLNALLGDPNKESVTFKTIRVVGSTLAEPDPEVFNGAALNPTVEVYVGNCEDIDGNGVIDDAERAACSGIVQEEETVDQQSDTNSSGNNANEGGGETGTAEGE